jgi:hypothetical protein
MALKISSFFMFANVFTIYAMFIFYIVLMIFIIINIYMVLMASIVYMVNLLNANKPILRVGQGTYSHIPTNCFSLNLA